MFIYFIHPSIFNTGFFCTQGHRIHLFILAIENTSFLATYGTINILSLKSHSIKTVKAIPYVQHILTEFRALVMLLEHSCRLFQCRKESVTTNFWTVVSMHISLCACILSDTTTDGKRHTNSQAFLHFKPNYRRCYLLPPSIPQNWRLFPSNCGGSQTCQDASSVTLA